MRQRVEAERDQDPETGAQLRRIIERRLLTPTPAGVDGEDLLRFRLEVVEVRLQEVWLEVRRLYWVVIGAGLLNLVVRWLGG
jgi:hypothetical protein